MRPLRIWSHSLKKSLKENFIFYTNHILYRNETAGFFPLHSTTAFLSFKSFKVFKFFEISLWKVCFIRRQAPNTFASGRALYQNKEKEIKNLDFSSQNSRPVIIKIWTYHHENLIRL